MMRKVNTVRFGEIDVAEDKIVRFADGLPAFEEEHEFVVIPYGDKSPYYFLQSLKTPDLAFLMTVPYIFFPDYEFRLEDDVTKNLGISTPDDIVLYTLLTIPNGEIAKMTTNLMAPVVINNRTLAAKQVVLEKSSYTTQHPLFQEKEEK